MNMKVIKKMSFDSPPKPYYVIREVVTSRGHTIDLPGIYSTKSAAAKEVARLKKKR